MRTILFTLLVFRILQITFCCKKYVPEVDELETGYPHWKDLHPADTVHFEHRPILNFSNRQRSIEPRCTCGKRGITSNTEDRVIGGQNALRHEFPWQVALVVSNTRVSICGGTLINNHFVLTASHCVMDISGGLVFYTIQRLLDIQVLLNTHTLNIAGDAEATIIRNERKTPAEIAKLDEIDGTIRRNPKKVFIHHGYISVIQKFQNTQFEDDIALILLDKPVDMTGVKGPWTSCLPETDFYVHYGPRAIGIISGWGITDYTKEFSIAETLQKLSTPIMDTELCKEIGVSSNANISHHFICIGDGLEGGRLRSSAGKGDSGGPLLIQEENVTGEQFIQIGVASFQNSILKRFLVSAKSYTAYTRITEYLPWIYSYTDGEENRGTPIKWCKRH